MQVQDEQSQQDERSPDEVIKELQRQIDELTAANLALKEQLVHRERFTGMVAHELRSPLTPIISYTQMIQRRSQGLGPILHDAAIVISQARRLVRIVDDLTDAAHLSTGQFSLITSPCDVAILAREVVEQVRPLAPYHLIIAETPGEPVVGDFDRERLLQALGNLIDNAVKYSDTQSTITVAVTCQERVIHVSVHNQGASIPTADIGQLFRPYVRLQATSARQGSGLGLYITKCIIEAHGGALRLEPHSAEGQGTTFSFDLPLTSNLSE
ncbi:MAG: HAMP domain-containing sensor histidine kinase [Ktedonobacteraceae bacterium]